MSSQAVLHALGYDSSPNYHDMVVEGVPTASCFSHVYRKAIKDCGLQGVYLIKERPRRNDGYQDNEVPVVFYCKAADEENANRIHRLVWNQDIAPFVLVETPARLRLYCGFRYEPQARSNRKRGILEPSIAFNKVSEVLSSLSSKAIDSGRVWDDWDEEVTPSTRVEWKLLDDLEKIEGELRNQGLSRAVSHALIGKYVYLRYLRDRNILSDRKLSSKGWEIDPEDIFSRNAKVEEFHKVNQRLDEWLNGAVFPLKTDGIGSAHLQLVAGVFRGDSPGGQLHLAFERYNFSFIPIETLSVIYQQFLHSKEKGEANRGKKSGAYYTPLPLVNYILDEMENKHPFTEGMKVLDPSCGSGAFLVQCYRALIEKRLKNGLLRPVELRELLVKHIYGVDRDGDACQVAELSLILTLLDYTTPPDLENTPQFKLPTLRNCNIFQADFFDNDSEWAHASNKLSFDWLVGNPPWTEFDEKDEEDRHVRDWKKRNAAVFPIGGNQVAEAFVWRSFPFLRDDAIAGLVLPAMTLFKSESKCFRQKLFLKIRAWRVTNFSNLRFVLFSGRSTRPAMTLFFTKTGNNGENSQILTFAPFVINQRSNRNTREGKKKNTWNIVVNGSELREISHSEAASGNIEPWKISMWGTFHDRNLLKKIKKRFPTLIAFSETNELTGPSEGFQLRNPSKMDEASLEKNPVEPIPWLEGRDRIDFEQLRGCGKIFTFPQRAIIPIPPELSYIRKRGGKAGLMVSEPPHIIVDEARRFAVYSDQFIAIPPRQVGIAGPTHSENILKALSVYLNSIYVQYHNFFTTPQWGISTPIATLDDLKNIPVPLRDLSRNEISEWADFRDMLADEGVDGRAVPQKLIDELNQKVYQLLGLRKTEQILIEDFVRWNMEMIDGKVPPTLAASPDDRTINEYLVTLKNELDNFISDYAGVRHKVEVTHDKLSAILAISLTTSVDTIPLVLHLDNESAKQLSLTRAHLLKEHGQDQWLYFNRDLRVYDNNTMYMFKPLERLHWTRRQAILDASEVIAETLGEANIQ